MLNTRIYRIHPKDILKASKIIMPSTPRLPSWADSPLKEDFMATMPQE